jgi:hypothetical protein
MKINRRYFKIEKEGYIPPLSILLATTKIAIPRSK